MQRRFNSLWLYGNKQRLLVVILSIVTSVFFIEAMLLVFNVTKYSFFDFFIVCFGKFWLSLFLTWIIGGLCIKKGN